MPAIEGSYQHVKSENLEAYFEKMDVPWVMRKVIVASSPGLEISRDGDEWKLMFTTPVKNNTIKFKLGEEFEESTPFGKTMKGKASMPAEDKLIINAKTADSDGNMTREFTFTDEGLEIVMKSDKHEEVAVRKFKRT